jgi:hypothetical protein
MFHRIPREILRSIDPPTRTLILDPFCGSGTVLLEGIALGYQTIGIDVNPIARLISKVKTTPLDPQHVRRHFAAIWRRARRDRTPSALQPALAYWFKPDVLRFLEHIVSSISQVGCNDCRDFYLIALSSTVRELSWADPSIAPPVKLNPNRAAIAKKRYVRDLERAQSLSGEDVFERFSEAVQRNLERLAELWATKNLGSARLMSPSREAAATGLRHGAVDIIMTSPPYCGAQKYVRSLRLEMMILGFDEQSIAVADRRTLGTERITKLNLNDRLLTECAEANSLIAATKEKNAVRALMLADYVRYLARFSTECRRVLRPNGNAFVTFGTSNVSGVPVDVSRLFALASERAGLSHVATLIDRIPSRGLLTRRHETAGRIDDERVVWLRG